MPDPEVAVDRQKLPSGGEFSPGQIVLGRVLELASQHTGSRTAFTEAIREEWFSTAAATRTNETARLGQQRKRAGNVVIGMGTYGLYDVQTQALTALGTLLRTAPNDEVMYSQFAADILRNREGLTVLQAVRGIESRRETPDKASIALELERLGIRLPRATTHHLVLLNWLRQAGVLPLSGGYEIDEKRTAELAGIALDTVDEWATFTGPQRAFIRTLRQLSEVHGGNPVSTQAVLETAEATLGPVFQGVSDRLRERVFNPLASAGWIVVSSGTGGRGGKSGTVSATAKLMELDVGSLPVVTGRGIPSDLRAQLNTPLEDVYRDLDSEETGRKGIALELLGIHIATDLGLTPVKLRLRGTETGGAEVDLVAESAHLQFSRWLFQCKNTPRSQVPLRELAKEVGVSVLLRAHMIVMVTTGTFSSEVRRYADHLAANTLHQVVLVDKNILARYRKSGAEALLDHFGQTAAATLRLKQPQVDDAADE